MWREGAAVGMVCSNGTLETFEAFLESFVCGVSDVEDSSYLVHFLQPEATNAASTPGGDSGLFGLEKTDDPTIPSHPSTLNARQLLKPSLYLNRRRFPTTALPLSLLQSEFQKTMSRTNNISSSAKTPFPHHIPRGQSECWKSLHPP